MLELHNNFFDKHCVFTKFEVLAMDTGSLFLALSEKDLYGCIIPTVKHEWNSAKWRLYGSIFTKSAKTFFPRTCCAKHKKHNRGEPGLLKEEFRCTKMICLCSKSYCSNESQSNKFKISSKGLNKGTLEDCGDYPMSKNCKELEEVVNVTSTNRGIRTLHYAVATYKQRKN